MSMTFIVDSAELRKTKAGNDYLAVKIGDKTVSFFEAADVAVPVQPGQAIHCDIKQLGRFWNGKNLAIAEDSDAVISEFPSDVTPAPDAGETFNQVVRASSRTYFIDVKSAKTGERYMTITESGGNEMEKQRVMVFVDHADEFVDAILKARDAMK